MPDALSARGAHGPAPLTPFKPVKEEKGWRAFLEYGNGQVGNLGVHMIDKVRWLAEDGGAWLDVDTAVSPRTYDAALLAAVDGGPGSPGGDVLGVFVADDRLLLIHIGHDGQEGIIHGPIDREEADPCEQAPNCRRAHHRGIGASDRVDQGTE